MIDNWLAITGHTITINFGANFYHATQPLGTGIVEIDPAYIKSGFNGNTNGLSYINNKGTPVLHSQLGALVHELGHALRLVYDNYTLTDYQGDNVKFINTIWKQLGLDKEISYIAQAYDLHTVGYTYTNGTAIDAAETGDRNWNSSALGSSNDLLIGGKSANILESGAGNDFLFGAGGDDQLHGDSGTDTAVYFGSPLDYDIRKNTDGSWSVRNVRGAMDAGSDTLKNIESIQFDATGNGATGKGHQTYQLQKNGLTFQTDFAIVIDTTGSMGSSIDSVKASASALIDAVFAGGKADARIGVVGFKDTTNGEPSTVILPFTDQDNFADRKAAALAAINGIDVYGGGDLPETDYDGLLVALNGTMGQWRAGAGIHRIALFTDAPAKDGYLAAQVNALAQSIGATIGFSSSLAGAGGSVDTFNLVFGGSGSAGLVSPGDPNADSLPPFVLTDEPIVPDTRTTQVQIFTIFTGPLGTDTTALDAIASSNGGKLLTVEDNNALVDALFTIIAINEPPSYLGGCPKTPANNGIIATYT